MKSKGKLKFNYRGFTLVELLVVIVIIATLAAVTLSVSQKMMRKAQANQSMQNMAQIAAVMNTYATDHQMKLPAAKGPVLLANGTSTDLQWNEVCLSLVYPDAVAAEWKTTQWWDANNSFLKNPMFKSAAGWAPLNPGYAMNIMIAENVALGQNPVTASPPLTTSVALASIPEPGKTPLIAPNSNWTFRFDAAELAKFDSSPQKDLLADGKLSIMFVDGHVEIMTPKEYSDKELALMPLPAN